VVQRFDVKTAGVDREARSLSGGNLQKFLVGREIATTPAVFVAAQPTWGVDAGAAALIHREIGALAAAGAAVLLISQDLDELFAVAHDIAVIAGGRLSPAEPVESVTVEEIGLLMGGQAPSSGQGSAHA
jgi:simple sugar transport system ATP-binding protein